MFQFFYFILIHFRELRMDRTNEEVGELRNSSMIDQVFCESI